MDSPRASLVIRCYNEADHLGKLLHGLSKQSMQDFEVILVDSGSTDGTIEIAKQFDVEEIVYIDPEEFSFGRALNYGCEAAKGEFCVIASAHVYPTRSDWLEQILSKFDEEVALVYGKQRGNEVTTFAENQIFKQWFPNEDIERQGHPFCNNANAAIRREIWEDYPYDEQLTGLEDVDWAKRVQKDGYDISYASEAEIIHVHDETAKEIFNRYRREAYAHKQIMPNQSFSLSDFITLSVKNILSDYKTALQKGELRGNLQEIPEFRLLQFWGTYRGFSKEGPIPEQLWQRFYYPDRDTFPESNASNQDEPQSSNDTTTNRRGESQKINYTERDGNISAAGEGKGSDATS
ncbi:glycosyltransferase family 2 protein [Haloferax sp. ATB1]|uniref:glycosyltransferase family 2 protein n=1 Tax=Haloferax sp. ATB1 TaxID=1508454 RepID=UPI0009E2D40C|nr:glycosyltransferase family A protein [Haloferax sp. ATB1]